MATVIKSTVEGKYLMFKGKPLVRQEQIINYGSMKDEYILQLMILKNREVEIGGVKNTIPSRVIAQVLKKDPTVQGGRKMVKQFVQILFIYFGLLPDIAIMAVGAFSVRWYNGAKDGAKAIKELENI